MFEYLKRYETFCKSINNQVEETNFGINDIAFDIAFFDKNNNVILRTNTHEGFIFVAKEIDELFNKKD